MNHLDALCCDACRAKVAAIEARVASTGGFTHQVYADRRALLAMVEALLGNVSAQRMKHEALAVEAMKLLSEEHGEVLRQLQQQAEVLLSHVPPVSE